MATTFEPIPNISQFCYNVLQEYDIEQQSIPVLTWMYIADTTDDERLSLAALILTRIAVDNGIDGMTTAHAHDILNTVTNRVMDKHPFVRWHLTNRSSSPNTIVDG